MTGVLRRVSGLGLAAALLLAATPPLGATDCTLPSVLWLGRAVAEQRLVNGLAPIADLETARCLQAGLLRSLVPALGPAVGYKVGLTNPEVQRRFGVEAPLAGVLLGGMILPDGSTVPADYGARPIFEADLLVTVRHEAINAATTPLQVAVQLSELRPFLELADLMVGEGEPLDAAVITAVNVGARWGVAGPPLAIEDSQALVTALAEMTVMVRDGDGKELARAPGRAILGQPLEAVIWLAGDLAAHGERLRAGDVISLGAFTPPMPPQPGLTVEAVYEGLPGGTPRVTASFR